MRNLMIGPLAQQEEVFGVLLLANREGDFGETDLVTFQALQSSVAHSVRNLLQCEGYRQLERVRQEYCAELSKALKDPLNRIREEVQSIYSRLGKLTPYYKQHCETIFFEVGRLYEISQEAAGLESGSNEKNIEDRKPLT